MLDKNLQTCYLIKDVAHPGDITPKTAGAVRSNVCNACRGMFLRELNASLSSYREVFY